MRFKQWRVRHALRYHHLPPTPVGYREHWATDTQGPYCATCGRFLHPRYRNDSEPEWWRSDDGNTQVPRATPERS